MDYSAGRGQHGYSNCMLGNSYLGVRGAGVAAVVSRVTGGVLQAEAGLVALSHAGLGAGVQQVVVAELIHAVEVAAWE